MKLLFDENFEQSIVEHFRTLGHDVVAAGVDDPGIADAAILARARYERRIVITNDLDFGTLIYRHQLAAAGIILMRLPGIAIHVKQATLVRLFEQSVTHLPSSFTVVSRHGIRIRPIPSLKRHSS